MILTTLITATIMMFEMPTLPYAHNALEPVISQATIYNPQIEMFARFKMKSSFHKTKRII